MDNAVRPADRTVFFVNLEETTLGVNNLVRRQTAESRHPFHIDGPEAAVQIARERAIDVRFTSGVLYVTVPADGFFTGVVAVTPETPLRASFEPPYISVVATKGAKVPAKTAVLAFRSRESLGRRASTADSAWELVGILASAVDGDEPLTPGEMAINAATNSMSYPSQEWERSANYWNRFARLAG